MSSFTIGKKMFLGVGALVVFTLTLGITALSCISSIGDHIRTIVSATVKKQTLAHQMNSDTWELIAAARGIEARGLLKDTAAIDKYHQEFVASVDSVQGSIDAITPLIVVQADKQALEDGREQLSSLKEKEQVFYKYALAGDMTNAVESYKTLVPPQRTCGRSRLRC
jgi:hypothetical protein